jgi:hypothetical protein
MNKPFSLRNAFRVEQDEQLYELSHRVIAVLSPELIDPKYRQEDVPEAGACYIVSEVLYHLWGKFHGYRPMRARTELGTHWWLQKATDQPLDEQPILDRTGEQFTLDELLEIYARGKGGGFMTKLPSRRAQVLIQRMLGQKTYNECGEEKPVTVDVAQLLHKGKVS